VWPGGLLDISDPYSIPENSSAPGHKRFVDLPRRRSLRLPEFDYSTPGAYFVTVCARNRQCLFGEIADGKMEPDALAELVAGCWNEIPSHFPNAGLDAFIVMPNHIHGILLFSDAGVGCIRPLQMVVGSFKAAVSRKAGFPVWQRNYYEHVIRCEAELNLVRHYIQDNPAHWLADQEHSTVAGWGSDISDPYRFGT
jgi:putative transposase